MNNPSASQRLQQAKQAARLGDKAKAHSLYAALLRDFPDNQTAQTALRTLGQAGPASPKPPQDKLVALAALFNQGKVAAVAQGCEAMLRDYPGSPVLWNLCGAAARAQGRVELALECFRKALALNPKFADAPYNMGVTLQLNNQLDAAEAAYRHAVSIKPDHAEALNNLGFVRLALGRFEGAETALRQALAARPRFADAMNNLGSALRGQGRSDEALATYRQALVLNPGFVEPQNNIGKHLLEQGKHAEALAVFEEAAAHWPNHPQVHDNLGIVLQAMGRHDAAILAHQKALALSPKLAEAQYHLALALKELGRLEEAADANRAALALRPTYGKAHNNYGQVLQEMGANEAAVAAYRRALALDGNDVEAFLNLTRLAPLAEDDPLLRHMAALQGAGTLSKEDLCMLSFAFANLHDRAGRFDQAFACLQKGHALHKDILHYDIARDRAIFAAIKQAAPGLDAVGRASANAPSDVVPIFILGMPRSGTTLIEQIISAHLDVSGAGELGTVLRLGSELVEGRVPVTSQALQAFRAAYLARVSNLARGRRHVTDKMPHNFLGLGLIVNAMPEARIVHVTRDPAATLWSNFMLKFNGDRIGYNNDLGDLIEYFRMYQDLMKFWSAQYPGRIVEVDYDALTQDQDGQTRRLIAELGLDWCDDCLSPQDNRRAVKTASNIQIRQPVYQGSSQKWRRYAPWIGGAFECLTRTPG